MKIDIEDLRRIDVQAGDVFVYRANARMTSAEADRLKQAWQRVFPDNQLIIIPNIGGDLFAIRQETTTTFTATPDELLAEEERRVEEDLRRVEAEMRRNGRLL